MPRYKSTFKNFQTLGFSLLVLLSAISMVCLISTYGFAGSSTQSGSTSVAPVAASNSSTANITGKTKSFWDAPSQEELKYKKLADQAQTDYGLRNSKTLQVIWDLSQCYLREEKYAQAAGQLKLLKEICVTSPSLCPIPIKQINDSYARATSGAKKNKGRRIYQTSPTASNAYANSYIPNAPGLEVLHYAQLNPYQFHAISREKMDGAWFVTGDHPDNYQFGGEVVNANGHQATTIKCTSSENSCASLTQTLWAFRFIGKRVRLTGKIKTVDANWASLWMSVLSQDRVTEFDNGNGRQISGTADWTPFSCVLDIPVGSTTISYGCVLFGKGQAVFDDLRIEEVTGKALGTTNNPALEYRNLSIRTITKSAASQPVLAYLLNSPDLLAMLESLRGSKTSIWEKTAQQELSLEREMEKSEIQNGLSHPQTMKVMWQLSQYYLNVRKYSQADRTLRTLQNAYSKNPKGSPISLSELNRALDAVAVGRQTQSEPNTSRTLKTSQAETTNKNYQDHKGPYNLNFDDKGSLDFQRLKLVYPDYLLGWIGWGNTTHYDFGFDKQNGRNNTVCGFISAKSNAAPDSASLVEAFEADRYKGRRVRFSAYLKTQGASNAELWLRAEDSDHNILAMDRTNKNPVKITADWTEYSCELDVPVQSATIKFGATLSTAGQLWIDDASFEVVGH
jgi:hypothetical protein